MINKAICCQCVLWLKSKIAKISTLKVKRIAKSLKFDPVNNSSLKVHVMSYAVNGGRVLTCVSTVSLKLVECIVMLHIKAYFFERVLGDSTHLTR